MCTLLIKKSPRVGFVFKVVEDEKKIKGRWAEKARRENMESRTKWRNLSLWSFDLSKCFVLFCLII